MNMSNALTHNGDNDYTLKLGHKTAWITVGKFSVYILRRYDGEVDVEICPVGHEFEEAPMDAQATSRVYNLPEEEN